MEMDDEQKTDADHDPAHRIHYVLNAGLGHFKTTGSPVVLDRKTQEALRPLIRLASLILLLWALSEVFSKITDAPKNAELILSLILRHTEREIVVGDLLERYLRRRETRGRFRADCYAYGEAFRSFFPFL